jgi:hypothetical protein
MTKEEKGWLAEIEKRDAENGPDTEPEPYWLTKKPPDPNQPSRNTG